MFISLEPRNPHLVIFITLIFGCLISALEDAVHMQAQPRLPASIMVSAMRGDEKHLSQETDTLHHYSC